MATLLNFKSAASTCIFFSEKTGIPSVQSYERFNQTVNTDYSKTHEEWKKLIISLKKKCKKKYGVGYQLKIAEKTKMSNSSICVALSLRYQTGIKNYAIIKKALEDD